MNDNSATALKEPGATPRRDRNGGRPGRFKWHSLFGPGLITGASDDDPSGIATYSQAGAGFGYDMAWSMIATYPLMAAIQEISARIGRVTGRGIAGNIRRHYPPWLLKAIVFLIVIANMINLGADLGAMADAFRLLAGGWWQIYVVGFALVCAWLEIFSPYQRYVSILKWTTLSLFAYVATVLVVEVPWVEVASKALIPSFVANQDYLMMIVAVLGTTISPYMFFWQSSQEAEDERVDPDAKPLLKAPEQARFEITRIRLDTYIGMAFSNAIGLFIIITTAATLHAHGATDIQSSSDAAEALRPIAGAFAFAVFAAGIIGTGMLAVPVLAGSAAYALGEALGWRTGLARQPHEAKAFYGTIAVATLSGILINFLGINPMKALVWSAVVNGVVAAPLMAVMMIMSMQKKVMGPFTLSRPLRLLGWLTTATMAIAALIMVAGWVV